MSKAAFSFKQALNEAIRDGLSRPARSAAFRPLTASLDRRTRRRGGRANRPAPVARPHAAQPLGTGGNLVNDGHLAALSIEHRGTIVSFDNDFGRFPGFRWTPP